MNIVEWLVSMPVCEWSLVWLSPFALALLREMTTLLMGALFMYFFKKFQVQVSHLCLSFRFKV